MKVRTIFIKLVISLTFYQPPSTIDDPEIIRLKIEIGHRLVSVGYDLAAIDCDRCHRGEINS